MPAYFSFFPFFFRLPYPGTKHWLTVVGCVGRPFCVCLAALPASAHGKAEGAPPWLLAALQPAASEAHG